MHLHVVVADWQAGEFREVGELGQDPGKIESTCKFEICLTGRFELTR